MILHNLISAARNLKRYALYSLINVIGLATGLAVAALILVYVDHELGYDTFQPGYQQIYRAVAKGNVGAKPLDIAMAMGPLGPTAKEEIEGINAFCRLDKSTRKVLLRNGTLGLHEEKFFYADPGFFQVFGYKLIEGNPDSALYHPRSLVLTAGLAERLFPGTRAMGKEIELNNSGKFTVTGLVESPPHNTHLSFNVLASLSTLDDGTGPHKAIGWGSINYYTYFRFEPEANVDSISLGLNGLVASRIGERLKELNSEIRLELQAIHSIHMNSKLFGELEPGNSMTMVVILLITALLIILLASVNFMNLSTARAGSRTREVAIRVALGATPAQIRVHFMIEFIFTSMVALVFAILLVEVLLPYFNQIIGKSLDFRSVANTESILVITGITLATGLFSGIYPAYYITRFAMLRQTSPQIHRKVFSGSLLIVFQFSISIVLIIITLAIYGQIRYLKNIDPGFKRENLLFVPMQQSDNDVQNERIARKVADLPGVMSVGMADNHPGQETGKRSCYFEGKPLKETILLATLNADSAYLSTLGIELLEGSYFSSDLDESGSVIINQSAAKLAGIANPLGKKLYMTDSSFLVVTGVVKDFLFSSLEGKAEPMAVLSSPGEMNLLAIRYHDEAVPQLVIAIEQQWQTHSPGVPLEYFFLEEVYDTLYRSERRIGSIFFSFTLLAVCIACLGLFGLTAFMIHRGAKSMGVKRVLGATVSKLVVSFASPYLRWVLWANILAWPLAWLLLHQWLIQFAVKPSTSFFYFPLSGLIAVFLAFITVVTKSWIVAASNPVHALKYE